MPCVEGLEIVDWVLKQVTERCATAEQSSADLSASPGGRKRYVPFAQSPV